MDPKYTQALVLVLFASILGVSNSYLNKDWQYSDWGSKRGSHRPGYTATPNKFIVGGSANWTFGFNYSVWAFKSGPFYVNDTLVFKYDPPSEKNIHPHSVYLLPDMWSFINCNLTRGVKIANETQGAVFKYDRPSDKNMHPHNVYLLPDISSFINYNLTKGVKIANETQGAGEGFELVLKKWKPYYFACNASDGCHCKVGQMKFFVLPYFVVDIIDIGN
ncbi:hypothetical protein GH714_008244 [Hevea brasiliensis]|uniref:Phytocyanin domain-containing protein n=1 Tax=Hevea brasiliensis TaxID=3981 RepID=A0A6A6LZL4_HEVBR|nr:hypothetical protein GH714_008244 [Hevea brasiliensis]